MMRLLHRDDAHPDLWPVYEGTLTALAGEVPLDVTLRRFERMLLEEVGYGLTLEWTRRAGPGSRVRYRWVPEQGFVADAGGYPGELLTALGEDRWNDDVRRLAKALLREALAPHLGDRPLRSRELFR